jgi:myo-inositol 2-dehydrogenase/D-chiro-inositol 1-dehydrogenase
MEVHAEMNPTLRPLPGPDAVRIGLVGAGFMGEAHAAAWRSLGVRSLTIYDSVHDAAARLAALFEATVARSPDELFAGSDVVDVCTPTHLHREFVEAAAKAGRPVICEKPLARTVEDAEAMIAACGAAGVPLFVAHVVRYINEYVAAKEAVVAGRVGRLAIVRLRRESARPNKAPDHWFFDPARSGGVMMDLLVHDYDYARYLAGDVESVWARTVRDASGADVDFGFAVLRHASGAITHVSGGWVYPWPVFRTGFEIAGDGGLIQYESTDAAPVTPYRIGRRDEGEAGTGLPDSPIAENPWALELADFVASIQGGGPPRVTARDGLEAVRIANAVIESSRTGLAVKFAAPPATEEVR